jgi:hypothetical protein
MNNKKGLVFTTLLFLNVFFVFGQSSNSSTGLIGKWFFDEEMVVIEFSRNRLSMKSIEDDDEDSEIYEYKSDTKSIFFDGEQWDYELKDNNTLIMMDPDDHSNMITGKRLRNNHLTFLTGKYKLVSDNGIFESLEFIDRVNVKIVAGLAGYRTTWAGKYEISGSNLILTINGASLIMEILADDIIVGDTIGNGSVSVFRK